MNKEYKFYNVISDMIKYRQCKESGVKQVLISYFYLRQNEKLLETLIHDDEIEIIVDSGLYSYFNSVKITDADAIRYSLEYIDFVREYSSYDCFVGFFELDFDLIGYSYYNFVKPFQEKLLSLTDKIILICQKRRTIEDIEEMLTKNIKTIAIPFASSIERNWFDYHLIIDKAHEKNKRVHLLGCSTPKYLRYAEQSDSSSWFMSAAMGEEARMKKDVLYTIHYSESEEIAKDYETRAKRNAKLYSTEFQKVVNELKKTNVEVLRLF